MTTKLIEKYIELRDNLNKNTQRTAEDQAMSTLSEYLTDEIGFNESLSIIETALNELLKANNINKNIDITSDISKIIDSQHNKDSVRFIKRRSDEKELMELKSEIQQQFPIESNSIFCFVVRSFTSENKANRDLDVVVENNNLSSFYTERSTFVVGSATEIVNALKKDAKFLKTTISKFDSFFKDVTKIDSSLIKHNNKYISLNKISMDDLKVKRTQTPKP